MKLKEFEQLSFDDKLFCIVDHAVFLDNYIDDKTKINCYALFNFFVELIYNPNENKISEIRAFNSGKQLDKYSKNISSFI